MFNQHNKVTLTRPSNVNFHREVEQLGIAMFHLELVQERVDQFLGRRAWRRRKRLVLEIRTQAAGVDFNRDLDWKMDEIYELKRRIF